MQNRGTKPINGYQAVALAAVVLFLILKALTWRGLYMVSPSVTVPLAMVGLIFALIGRRRS